ncbi:MAG: hypothetical protein KKF77_06705 [Proteobacteria bacterium]|nr:hypothetical protein [Pseudomonadota bacterium]
MLIRDKSLFNRGLMLMASFLCIFVSLFLPIWGGHGNGLDAADNMFNRLSKGSSYFIPGVQKQVLEMNGKQVTVTAKIKDTAIAPMAVANLIKAGATAEFKDDSITYSGDLGAILAAALTDADDLFNDRGQAVIDRYSATEKGAEKTIAKAWWTVLDASIKPMQKQKLIKEAKVVGQVNKRGLEPGYNFYGIASEKVLDNVLPLVGLLVFYVIYTMWYGYAIFDMFGGIGLGMSKPKVKKEA